VTEEIIHSSEYPAYHRRPHESASEYEMFVEWCKIPASSRNIGNYCRRTGFQPRIVRKKMELWSWESRTIAFDNDSLMLRPNPSNMDDEAAIAGQMAAAQTLLDLGLSTIQIKNPSLINVKDALKLVEKGVEIQRRALGQADLNVQFTVEDMSRVNKLIDELDGEIVEVEELDDIADDAPDIPM
jgi:hypothetical protein